MSDWPSSFPGLLSFMIPEVAGQCFQSLVAIYSNSLPLGTVVPMCSSVCKLGYQPCRSKASHACTRLLWSTMIILFFWSLIWNPHCGILPLSSHGVNSMSSHRLLALRSWFQASSQNSQCFSCKLYKIREKLLGVIFGGKKIYHMKNTTHRYDYRPRY